MRMKKAMALSTIGYLMVGIFLFLILTFIYFGHTGFFQKIYRITDKLGITTIAKSVEEVEEKIIASNEEDLSPEEQAKRDNIRAAVKKMVDDLKACAAGSECVCGIRTPTLPEGYVLRFTNAYEQVKNEGTMAKMLGKESVIVNEKRLYITSYKYKSRKLRVDYDEDFQGETGVDFINGVTYQLDTHVCLVNNLGDYGRNAKVVLREPAAGMVQMYWENKIRSLGMKLWATEARGSNWLYNSERDYRVFGSDENGGMREVYKTRQDGDLCFFVIRFGVDKDDDRIDDIDCEDSKEVYD